MSQKRFSWRSFTTLLIAWAFLTLILSGAVLYIAPPGRIANWTQWRMAALTKAQWQAVHVLTAIVFLTGGLFHLFKFNWKVFIAYLRRRSEPGFRFGREIAFSAVLFLLVVSATIVSLPPFGTVMTAGEWIKQSWEERSESPPVPHLEEQKISAIAARIPMEPEAAVRLLTGKGISVPGGVHARLADVARHNRTSPRAIYQVLQANAGVPGAAAHAPGSGSGLGERTVAVVAQELGMTPDAAVSALAARNLTARPQETLREVAFRHGKRPFEIMAILKESVSSGY